MWSLFIYFGLWFFGSKNELELAEISLCWSSPLSTHLCPFFKTHRTKSTVFSIFIYYWENCNLLSAGCLSTIWTGIVCTSPKRIWCTPPSRLLESSTPPAGSSWPTATRLWSEAGRVPKAGTAALSCVRQASACRLCPWPSAREWLVIALPRESRRLAGLGGEWLFTASRAVDPFVEVNVDCSCNPCEREGRNTKTAVFYSKRSWHLTACIV